MRQTLQLLAAVVAGGAFIFWGSQGANRGWTKNQVPVIIVDEVTGIESPTYVKKFVPGLDFLGLALAGAGALGVGSLFLSRKTKTKNETKTRTA